MAVLPATNAGVAALQLRLGPVHWLTPLETSFSYGLPFLDSIFR